MKPGMKGLPGTEVITGRRQRRNWTDEEKARILAESAQPKVTSRLLPGAGAWIAVC